MTSKCKDLLKTQSCKMKRKCKINQQVNKVKAGANKFSIRSDLAKDGMIFSEESNCGIYEMGNVELTELKQTSETTQCPSLPEIRI